MKTKLYDKESGNYVYVCSECSARVSIIDNFCPRCGNDISKIDEKYKIENSETVIKKQEDKLFVKYAGFWRRFVAIFIDSIITSILYAIINFINYFVYALYSYTLYSSLTATLLFSTLWWIYFATLESSSKQATIGKMALGIIVTDYNGNRISFGRATGRHFGKILSYLIFGIGYLMAGFTKRKQALHDIIAGCLVIKGKVSRNNEFDKKEDQEKCPTCNIVHQVGKFIGLKLCPNCNAYQDGRHIKCPECSYDISNVEITKK